MTDELLVKCRYGWRQVVQLYRDYLEINTTRYNLADLIYVLPTCRRVLGKSSLRLELCFKGQVVVLRGISNLDAAQEMIHYLQSRCSSFSVRELQAQDALQVDAMPDPPITQGGDVIARWDTSVMRVVQMPTTPLAVPVQQVLTAFKQSQGYVEQKGSAADVGEDQLPSGAQEEHLPRTRVPLRLLEGENAHYCTSATWCDEPLNDRAVYHQRVKDQGTLILTNLRIIYLGRKSQAVWGYAHLVQVTRRQEALVLLTKQAAGQEIFMVSSLEGAEYLFQVLQRLKRPSQVVEEAVRPVLESGGEQAVPGNGGLEPQNREVLADKDTQVITRVADQEGPFAGYEQHMEWLEQLGITSL
jgi:hypothetical protein